MPQHPICPHCGENMRLRRSEWLSPREAEVLFECRTCRVSFFTTEPALTDRAQHTK